MQYNSRVRNILLIAVAAACLLALGCPKPQAQQSTDPGNAQVETGGTESSGGQPGSSDAQRLAIVFSATETDGWSREVLNLIGGELGFDPWASPGESGRLDAYGPHNVCWKEYPVEISIAFCGLTTASELLGQQAIAEEVHAWIEGQGPDILWLDGDPAQLHIGKQLASELPVLFTGVVNDSVIYYEAGQHYTGVYQRHSLPAVMGVVWRTDPDYFNSDESVHLYALITDDSLISLSRAGRFALLEQAMGESHRWRATDAASGWEALRARVLEVQDKADALVFCGVGEPGCSAEFIEEPMPRGLLAGNSLPAVVLGPSRMDQSGATVLSIKPSAAVAEAMDRLEKLLAGKPAAAMGVAVPEEMNIYISEVGLDGGGTQDTADEPEQ